MIGFLITKLFDDNLCQSWLERHLHSNGFVCPTCGSADRRRFRTQDRYDAYRCRVRDAHDALLNGTIFAGIASVPLRSCCCCTASPKGGPRRVWRVNCGCSGKPSKPCASVSRLICNTASTATVEGQTF